MFRSTGETGSATGHHCASVLPEDTAQSGQAEKMGKILIYLGILLLIAGIALSYAPWLFSWFGKLPGDIRIERENGVFFFPFTSMLLLSIVISAVLAIFFRR